MNADFNVISVNLSKEELDSFNSYFNKIKQSVELRHIQNCIDARKQLFKLASTYLPDLILISVSQINKACLGLIQLLKSHTPLKLIPILILSDSQNTQDIKLVYEANSNFYIHKSISMDETCQTLNSLIYFLKTYVKLPSRVLL
ncbi:MAG: hypothetical protein OEZ01_01800 [Candidatus Heimdallarchaeota archaeon]|nr:hypothetical protein [Candidatus Heimdallarchaeota archaeon]MDH5644707.1 hypothetical protein [Candidatus Heimdallarchaeota archaeon]